MSTSPESERLFFALWPPDEVRAKLAELQGSLMSFRGRATQAAQLHLTLLFLGAVAPERRSCLEAYASSMAVPPFDLILDTLGYWPRPQIVWLGNAAIPEPLRQLVNGLREGATHCGGAVEARPFRVHLTLMRKVPPRPRPPRGMVPALRWPVREFRLMRSQLRPGGSEYSVVRAWPLG